jgi:hypothetical protein
MAFSKDVVVIVFDLKSEEREVRSSGSKIWSGWRLVGLFFDRKTGEMRAERSWIADLHPELFPTAKGNFVLFIGEFPGPLQIPLFNPKVLDAPRPSNLILLSPDGEELERIGLPVRGKSMKEWWEVIASPSGKSFLLTHVEDEHREYVLLDAETLERRPFGGTTIDGFIVCKHSRMSTCYIKERTILLLGPLMDPLTVSNCRMDGGSFCVMI